MPASSSPRRPSSRALAAFPRTRRHAAPGARLVAALLALALALPALALAPPGARAAGIQVTSAADTADTAGVCTLRDAIRAAEADAARGGCPAGDGDDAITFAPGIVLIVLGGTLPQVTTPLTITGPGSGALTIRGDNTFPLLDLHGPGNFPEIEAAITGLTLDRGLSDGTHGANLTAVNLDLTLTDVALTNGTAGVDTGGSAAIFSSGDFRLDRVVATDNTAPRSPAFERGAALSFQDRAGNVTATITNSRIAGTKDPGEDGSGGGIAILHNRPTDYPFFVIAITATTIAGNAGRGIDFDVRTQNDATLTLTNSTVDGNAGGGIGNHDGALRVSGSTVSRNGGNGIYLDFAKSTEVTNSTLSDNDGAGLYSGTSSQPRIWQSTLVNNRGAGIGLGTMAGATVRASIVAGNTRDGAPKDCDDDLYVKSGGDNLFVQGGGCPLRAEDPIDILVGVGAAGSVYDPALADNGGPTLTHNLVAGGPALDRIPLARCPLGTDQRGGGFPRPATPGGLCDIGAIEYHAPAPTPSPSPSPSATPSPTPEPTPSPTASPTPTPTPSPTPSPSPSASPAPAYTVAASASGGGGVTPAGTTSYAAGTVASYTAAPSAGAVFVGWTLDGQYVGYPTTLTLTVNANRALVATFVPRPTFADIGTLSVTDQQAVTFLAALGIVNPAGVNGSGQFQPAVPVKRAEVAAFVARVFGWQKEFHANPFPDKCDPSNPGNCIDDELWNNVAALKDYGVVGGYTDPATCAAGGTTAPCYLPRDVVQRVQVVSVVARAFILTPDLRPTGFWPRLSASPAQYADVPDTGTQRSDLATYRANVGTVPGQVSDTTYGNPSGDSSRLYVVQVLYAAFNAQYGIDRVP